MVRGYVSDIDASVQPYGLVIPESYDFNSTQEQRVDIWYHGRVKPLSELKFIDQRETEVGKLQIDDARLQWWRQFRGEPRVTKEIDLTPDDIQNSHLILWGDPSSNSILGRIQNSLPVQWDADQFSLHGNQHDARTQVPVLIYPNPLNPHRYVVLNTSFTFSEFSGGTNSLQIPKLPDWAVIDLSVPRSQRHPAAVVNAGFFDEHWQLKDH